MRNIVLFFMPLFASAALANGYVGAAVGESDNSLGEESTTMLELSGGFNLSQNFAVEGSYLNLGEVEAFGREVGIAGFSGLAVVKAPLAETVNVFAKAGLYRWSATISDNSGGDAKELNNGVDLTYGAGVDFGVAKNFDAVFEYRIIDFEEAPQGAENISVGVRYHFY